MIEYSPISYYKRATKQILLQISHLGAMSERNALTEFLADHPRLMGALLTACILLTQAGSAIAANGSTTG